MVDLFNWALHCKSRTLQYFIRAVDLNAYHDATTGEIELKGVPGFIAQCVYECDSTLFTSSHDLKTAYMQYLEITGEGEKSMLKTRRRIWTYLTNKFFIDFWSKFHSS